MTDGAEMSRNHPRQSETENSKQKQSLYLPEDVLDEIMAEAARQDRSLSWVVQRAWIVARARIQAMPGKPPP